MRQPVIGVTGLPCAGKSLAASLLADGRVGVLPPGDLLKADDIGHKVLERPEVVEQLRRRFGDSVIAQDPAETRRRIAARVFADPADLAWQEALVHPLVGHEIEAAIACADGKRPVVVEAALLTAAGLDRLCDVVVLVEARVETRQLRAARRGWDRAELERRDARQATLFTPERLRRLEKKLAVVHNDRDDDRLAEALNAAWTDHTQKTYAVWKGILQ